MPHKETGSKGDFGGNQPGGTRVNHKDRFRTRSFQVTDTDLELLAWVAAYLGSTKAEVLRSAIRSYALQMQQIARSTERKGDG